MKVSYATPWACPRCGAEVRMTPHDRDETEPVEECVSCGYVLPAVAAGAEWRRDVVVVAAMPIPEELR